MQENPRYDDVVGEVLSFLDGRIAWCEKRGIPRSRIAIDPGIGFGKTFDHNLQILAKPEAICQPWLYAPGGHLAEGLTW